MDKNAYTYCERCSEEIPEYGTDCPVCASFIGFPNVRRARSEEQDLETRYQSALESTSFRQVEAERESLEAAVKGAHIVMARSLKQILPMLDNNNLLISTYMQQVNSNARKPDDNPYDRNREAFEAKIHPYDHRDIHYATLSLTDQGLSHWGNCHISFKLNTVEKRSTIFEENIWKFLIRHAVQATQDPPRGYRAAWDHREKLAVCKLHSKLKLGMASDDFQEVLIHEDGQDSDFLEVHIFGQLGLKAVKSICIKGRLSGTDAALLNAYEEHIKRSDIQLHRID